MIKVWNTKMLIVNVHTDKWPDCDLQRTDPPLVREGALQTGQHIPDPNSWKGSNIWSNIHKVGSTPIHTDFDSDLSSERTPHKDRTTNSRPKLLKRKQYLVKRSQSGIDTKTYWMTDWLTDWLWAVKWLWLWRTYGRREYYPFLVFATT
jgi:hypothetical protein